MRLTPNQVAMLQNAALLGVVRKRNTFREFHRTMDQLHRRGLLELFEIDRYRLTNAGRDCIAGWIATHHVPQH